MESFSFKKKNNHAQKRSRKILTGNDCFCLTKQTTIGHSVAMKKMLSELKTGEKIKISNFMRDVNAKLLLSLGLTPGDELQLLSRAPFGGPLTFQHENNFAFALRRFDAKRLHGELTTS